MVLGDDCSRLGCQSLMLPIKLLSTHMKYSLGFYDTLRQWFLTFFEVLNPASFISAFTEPFVIGKIKYDFFKT